MVEITSHPRYLAAQRVDLELTQAKRFTDKTKVDACGLLQMQIHQTPWHPLHAAMDTKRTKHFVLRTDILEMLRERPHAHLGAAMLA